MYEQMYDMLSHNCSIDGVYLRNINTCMSCPFLRQNNMYYVRFSSIDRPHFFFFLFASSFCIFIFYTFKQQ